MTLTFPPRLSMARIPTPLELLTIDWEPLGNLKVWIKRDDLTGAAMSGNKVRKLDFLVADALNEGADTLITCGGIQSNHARATAIAAATHSMQSVLFLRGDPPAVPDGNVLLDRLVGARITYITRDQYVAQRNELMAAEAARLEGEGRRPYVIPEGGSNPLGCWGYLDAAREMSEQIDEPIDYVVCATGSGGTQGGLILGCQLFMPESQVVGINVCDDEAYFQRTIGALLRGWEAAWGGGLDVDTIHIADGYVGRGYALNTTEELVVLRDLARKSGLILDPVYTLKAFLGMAAEARRGRFRPGSRIIFLHTGGIFGLFPKREEIPL